MNTALKENFSNHFKEHHTVLLSFIYRMTANLEDAKDLAQETFQTVFKNSILLKAIQVLKHGYSPSLHIRQSITSEKENAGPKPFWSSANTLR